MRVLLIHSPYRYPHAYAMRTELLGLTSLAAAVRQAGHEVSVFDPTLGRPTKLPDGSYYYGATDETLTSHIRDAAPDVLGLSCHYAYSRDEAFRVASLTKQMRSDTVTVMGGLYPSVYRTRAFRLGGPVDYLLTGEAEESFPALLSALASKPTSLGEVDGLIYGRGATIACNPKRTFIADLDRLPFPARDLVDIRRYMTTGSVLYGLGGRPTLSLLTSRSCPNRCSFCNMHLVHGPRWRPRSPENVLAELDEILNRHHAQHVFVMDDNFTLDPDRVKLICEGILRRNYRFRWNTPNGISVKNVDEEMARLMKRAGCANVCVAIESGSEYIRNHVMKKGVSDEQIVRAVAAFKKADIPVGAFIVLGMPEEDHDHFAETVRFVNALPLSFVATTFAIPFPGTELHASLVRAGVLSEDFEVGMDNFNFPVFETACFTKRDLLARRRALFTSFYASHAFSILKELFTGRLTWVGGNLLRRFLAEKCFG